jgi:hypothetical protein
VVGGGGARAGALPRSAHVAVHRAVLDDNLAVEQEDTDMVRP